jgi:hypothetical protein
MMQESRESRGMRQALAYAFVSVLLVLVIVMLAITPNPAWMEGAPNESAVGAAHPIIIHQSNSTETLKAKQLQLASVPLNPGQIRAIMSVCAHHTPDTCSCLHPHDELWPSKLFIEWKYKSLRGSK